MADGLLSPSQGRLQKVVVELGRYPLPQAPQHAAQIETATVPGSGTRTRQHHRLVCACGWYDGWRVELRQVVRDARRHVRAVGGSGSVGDQDE